MSHSPSTELLALLARLGLAAPAEVHAVARRAKKLARGLPLFDSVWVDALAQAGTITPYQATEINAGRAERLVLGPYLLRRPVTCSPYADVFQAVERQTRREARLLVAWLTHVDRDSAESQLQALLSSAPRLAEAGVDHIETATLEACDPHVRLWAAADKIDGVNVADWMTAQGRLPPAVVLEIARQMVADLRVLERFGLVHGDLCPASVLLSAQGRVHLPHPGVRPLVRPEEGYGRIELAPAAYETLAPERIIDGTPPDVQSELFACGCLWWHLLAGRSPITGGDSLAKLNYARAARIPDVGRMAPETPPQLAAVIARCVSAEPTRRGESFAEVVAQLGPSTRDGRQATAECVRVQRNPPRTWVAGRRTPRRARRIAAASAGVAGCVIATLAILYPLWSRPPADTDRGRGNERVNQVPTVVARAAAKPLPETQPAEYLTNENPEHGSVSPVSFETDANGNKSATIEDVLILDSTEPIAAETLELRPGRIVRGRENSRPQIDVRGVGLLVSVSDVRFENIDFTYQGEPVETGRAAFVRLDAARIEFRGCSLRGPRSGGNSGPVGVYCVASSATGASPLPRHVVLDRCAVSHLGAAVETSGAVVLSIDNVQTLLVECGSLLKTEWPILRHPISLRLSNVTLRSCDYVLACRFEQLPSHPGRISVTASDCVFAPRHSIFNLQGPQPPLPMLKMIQWTGQGSLLDEKATMVTWQLEAGEGTEQIDDADVAIDGLARSKLQFAAEDTSTPAESQLMKWNAPVGGIAPPGVDVTLFPQHTR